MNKQVTADESIIVEEIVKVPDLVKTVNLYVTVDTYDAEGNNIGYRVVDMHHYGTRAWLYDKHMWWATHNGYTVRVAVATPEEINEYLAKQAKALQDKFAKKAVAA